MKSILEYGETNNLDPASVRSYGVGWGTVLAQVGKKFVERCNPRNLMANPILVMLSVGALLATFATFEVGGHSATFNICITALLWVTLVTAILAEAYVVARNSMFDEPAGKELLSMKARKIDNGVERLVPISNLHKQDLVVCESGNIIPANGIVVQGTAIVDESAITGQSPPVVRENGGEQNVVFGRTSVLGGRIVIRLTSTCGRALIDRLSSSPDRVKNRQTRDEKIMEAPLWLLVVGLSVVVIALPFVAQYGSGIPNGFEALWLKLPAMVGIWICVFPLAIAELLNIARLSAVGRLLRKKIVPTDVRALESAGHIDVLILDEREVLCFNKHIVKENILSVENTADSFTDLTDGENSPVAFPSNKFQQMGIRTVLTSTSGQASADALAAEAGVDDVSVCKAPADKIAKILSERTSGHVVAVIGDEDDNALAMAHANVGFTMNGLFQKPGRRGNTVALNGRPNRLIEVIETGRRLTKIQKILTRFGIAETASLSIIILFPLISMVYGGEVVSRLFPALNFLRLTSPQNVILGIGIFNVLVLITLAFFVLKFVDTEKWEPRFSLHVVHPLTFGLAGFAIPLLSVKLIDLVVNGVSLIR